MKHKGCTSDIQSERNRYIATIFIKMKRSCQYASMYEICEAISEKPADRHYLSEEMGAMIWGRWKATGTLPNNANAYKKKLYHSFIRECTTLYTRGMKNRDVIRYALERSADCLGISPHRVFVILKKKGLR